MVNCQQPARNLTDTVTVTTTADKYLLAAGKQPQTAKCTSQKIQCVTVCKFSPLTMGSTYIHVGSSVRLIPNTNPNCNHRHTLYRRGATPPTPFTHFNEVGVFFFYRRLRLYNIDSFTPLVVKSLINFKSCYIHVKLVTTSLPRIGAMDLPQRIYSD